jgi:DNA topoisomerase VI subunit A
VLALVDSDPYGLKILSVYMKGSMNMSYDSRCGLQPSAAIVAI